MSETITFSITEKDTGANIPAEQLMRRYKVYCREVSQLDLEAKGGFALQGQMLRSSFGMGSERMSTQASGKNPVVICVDKRDPNNAEKGAPVMGRWGCLLMPPVSISCGVITTNPWNIYDEIKFSFPGPYAFNPVAYYASQSRTVLASGFEKILSGQATASNPYYTIAHDLDYLEKQHIFKFYGGVQVSVIPNLDKSVKPREGIHGRFWLPGTRKYMGEIGGIVLSQNQMDPYGQPEFLAETLIAEFDNIPSGELENLLALAKDQQGRFVGMKAQFDMLEQLLEAKIKAGDKEICTCGHPKYCHDLPHRGNIGHCLEITCPCLGYIQKQ